VVYAHNYSDLKLRLEEVFIRRRGANLKLKSTKVKLFQREIQFPGHRISRAGVAMDPDKLADIVRWHRPTSVHEVRQFLGLCRFYRRYVTTRKSQRRYTISRNAERNSNGPKKETALLKHSKKNSSPRRYSQLMSQDNGDFTLDVDASNWVVGAFLQQEQDGLLKSHWLCVQDHHRG